MMQSLITRGLRILEHLAGIANVTIPIKYVKVLSAPEYRRDIDVTIVSRKYWKYVSNPCIRLHITEKRDEKLMQQSERVEFLNFKYFQFLNNAWVLSKQRVVTVLLLVVVALLMTDPMKICLRPKGVTPARIQCHQLVELVAVDYTLKEVTMIILLIFRCYYVVFFRLLW